jgi:ATP synthase protein I
MMVLTIAFYLWIGDFAALSAGYGWLVAMLNVLVLLWRRHRADTGRALSAGQSLWVLYRTALERFVLVGLLFAMGMGGLKLAPLPLLTGFLVGQLALVLIGIKGKPANHVV